MSDWANLVTAWLVALLPWFGQDAAPVYSGYVEGNYIYVGAAAPGRVTEIAVGEGDHLEAGDLLFRLEDVAERAALEAAKARVREAEAQLDDLLTGSREAEIDVLRAALDRAQVERNLAEKELNRSATLLERALVPEAKVDADRATLEELDAQVAELRAQLHVATLPAREARVSAASAAVEAARAELDLARSRLDDRSVATPAAGRVERLYYDVGEVASAAAPVVSVLPPGDVDVIFFIPEPVRSQFAPGISLAVSCDGCPDHVQATVTLIDTEPQYTPPIIYSRQQRSRLVFRAEARIEGDVSLSPGQPVEVGRP